jgi:hypothetical protein
MCDVLAIGEEQDTCDDKRGCIGHGHSQRRSTMNDPCYSAT